MRLRNASRRLAGVYLTVIIFGIVRGLVERGRFPGLQSAVVNANASRRRIATLRIRQTFCCCLLKRTYRIAKANPLFLIFFSSLSVFFFFFLTEQKPVEKKNKKYKIIRYKKRKKNLIINYINDILFSSTFLNYRIIIVEESKV